MDEYSLLPRNRFFEVIGGMNVENRGDNKVAMLSQIDMSQCVRLRSAIGVEHGVKPSYTALVTRAVALTLKQLPYANRMTVEWPFFRRIVQLNNIHITVAVERDEPGTEQAVYAGTVRNTDTLDLVALTNELQRLAKAQGPHGERWSLLKKIVHGVPAPLARTILKFPRVLPSLWIEHRGGAVMVSSPAKYGVDMLVGNWPWPIGISFGLVKDRPVAIDGKVEIRPTMTLIMSFDRRLMGGAPAARFFRTIADTIENAETTL
ncbi:2-oxo acid dehydrogenase subunit E2 [Zoogloea sp.]|uniref:2-oxo acid dehydrogenase subunit E2 n=1 Tax=Zoogloea sp. TaxID=49181 RepID=UPI0035B4715B